jgi:CRISPR-associated endonuclease/helicase Cas3
MIFYAHSLPNRPPAEWQTLDAHSNAVARLAEVFASHLRGAEWGRAVGLLHDVGKARLPFQQMLEGLRTKDEQTYHAKYGARLAFDAGSLPLAFAVAGHHAGLPDSNELQRLAGNTELLSSPPEHFFPSDRSLPFPATDEDDVLPLEFFTRILFSCLIDADRLDSAFWERMGDRTIELATAHMALDPPGLLSRLLAERERQRRKHPAGVLSDMRNRIFDACVSAGEKPQGFFSLTVPTGGGKTLSGMAFALAHAKAHKLRRIIVVIPYLSIIEQNAAEYRRVLDPERRGVVLECHSSAKPDTPAAGEELLPLDLVTENWDAPIIVTTSVQFLESLFAASPSRARKLHNIADSIVLFDEVQTLPTHLLTPVLSVFRELASRYGVSFVFSSATQPAFRKSLSLPEGFASDELHEIVPDPASVYRTLRRVDYVFEPAPMTWDEVADKLRAEKQCLCIVNLTRHAYELWKGLNPGSGSVEPRPIHLSSAMCPAHRLAVIRRIRRLLRAGKPCRVVATQLIEAGVDVDFPVVWRAMGPLDSIVQAAGRCNREGGPVRGCVHVFTPAENRLPGGIYSTATGQAANTLETLRRESGEDGLGEVLANDPHLFADYFTALYQLAATDGADIQSERRQLNFRSVAEKVKVIDNGGRGLVIPVGKGKHVVESVRNREVSAGEQRFTRQDLRSLQRYMVNVRERDFDFLRSHGLVSELLPNLDLFVLDLAQYDKNLGVLKPDQAPAMEDFFL